MKRRRVEIITQLTFKLTPPENAGLNFNMSSLFHGWLMELVPVNFAQHMHEISLRPFSQFLSKRGDDWFWTVNTLNEDAYNGIVPALTRAASVYLKHKDMTIKLSEPEIKQTSFDELFREKYLSGVRQQRIINLKFITPTAFKSEGQYLFYPEIKNIFYSVISKYDAVSEATAINDESLLENILLKTQVIGYNLRSGFFQLEGVKIPSFTGRLAIKINGDQTMVSLVNMLLDFSSYSGIGIKNALGMGAVTIF